MADERSRTEERNNERVKAIDLALAQIEKQFGKGSIMRLGSKEAIVPIAVISTGAISFDAALGVGGFPRGRVVEIFGPESSGKTTIALQVIAEAQKTGGMVGNPETTTGGRALKFYSSVRIDIRRIAAIKEGDVVTGSRTRVKIVKNKVAAPFRESEFDILYGEGISREGDLIDLAVNNKILEKSGSWFSYKGKRIGQGRENARQFLKDNKETLAKLELEVRKTLGLIPASTTPAAATGTTGSTSSAKVA